MELGWIAKAELGGVLNGIMITGDLVHRDEKEGLST